MQGLIQKSGYIKPGGVAGNYAEYIATRDGVELLNRSSQYMKYISKRPRSHGLFTNTECADLEKTMEEVNGHTAPVWTFIYSLRREDAARLGYDSAASWQKLLLAHQAELAEATRLLHHMSEIFRGNSVPPQAPAGQQIDRKLQLKIREKKIAMGHKPDDHEEQSQGQSMTQG